MNVQEPAAPGKPNLVFLTPELAEQLLQNMVPNRPVGKSRVEEMSRDIVAGRYLLNGDSLKVNSEGQLFDGQHRCHAVIKAQTGIWVWIFSDLEYTSALMATVDCNKSRSRADIWRLGELPFASSIPGALAVQWRYQNNKMNGTDRPTKQEEQILLGLHPGIMEGFHNPDVMGVGKKKLRSLGIAVGLF
ncbi:MAG: hypothetical protein Q8P12_02825, partial [bacterium]|nr:hypothetical protein [bacterium]